MLQVVLRDIFVNSIIIFLMPGVFVCLMLLLHQALPQVVFTMVNAQMVILVKVGYVLMEGIIVAVFRENVFKYRHQLIRRIHHFLLSQLLLHRHMPLRRILMFQLRHPRQLQVLNPGQLVTDLSLESIYARQPTVVSLGGHGGILVRNRISKLF